MGAATDTTGTATTTRTTTTTDGPEAPPGLLATIAPPAPIARRGFFSPLPGGRAPSDCQL